MHANYRIKWLLTNLKEAFSPVKIAPRVWNLTQIPDLFQTYSRGIKITFVTGFFSAQRCRLIVLCSFNLINFSGIFFQMLFELEGYEDDLDYRSIPLSAKTPCTEAVELIVKKFQLPGKANEYYLVEVSEECEGKAFCLSI